MQRFERTLVMAAKLWPMLSSSHVSFSSASLLCALLACASAFWRRVRSVDNKHPVRCHHTELDNDEVSSIAACKLELRRRVCSAQELSDIRCQMFIYPLCSCSL